MQTVPCDLDLVFLAITPEQEEEVCRVWVEIFCRQEPVMRTLDVKESDFLPYARARLQAARRHQLSFVIRDKRRGDLIGFRLLTDLAAPPVTLPSGSNVGFLFDCFDEMQEKWTEGAADFREGQWAYSIGVAVCGPFTRRGIAGQIYTRSEEILSEKGFRGLVMHCTNAYTTDICRRLGYREVASRAYAEIQDTAGRFPFKNVPRPHVAMTMFEKRLIRP